MRIETLKKFAGPVAVVAAVGLISLAIVAVAAWTKPSANEAHPKAKSQSAEGACLVHSADR